MALPGEISSPIFAIVIIFLVTILTLILILGYLVYLKKTERSQKTRNFQGEGVVDEENDDRYIKQFGKYGTCSPLLLSPSRTPTRHLRSTSTPSDPKNILRSSPQHFRRNSNPTNLDTTQPPKSSSFPAKSSKSIRPNTLFVQNINLNVTKDCHQICPVQPPSTIQQPNIHLRSHSSSPTRRNLSKSKEQTQSQKSRLMKERVANCPTNKLDLEGYQKEKE